MANFWMVRAGAADEDALQIFLKKGIVAIGGAEIGPPPAKASKADLLERFRKAIPEMKEGSRQAWVSQQYRFMSDIQPGDRVMTYDRGARIYYLGRILDGPSYDEKQIPSLPNFRKVEWTHQVARDSLSAQTRSSLGAIQTLFRVSDESGENLLLHAHPFGGAASEVHLIEPVELTEEKNQQEQVSAEILDKAEAFIEDAIARLSWSEMQDLVAGILRAMGYRTKVSPPGSDRGVDIFASPDGLGLQEPRIFVEVKHRKGQMGSQEIRAFLGGRSTRDRCLYVSTGGFSKDALYEAARASIPLTLIKLTDLRDLLLEYYESLDPVTRALVPLRRFYWPER